MIKTVQSLWIGGELSKLEQLCIRSFLANDHEFKLYVYEDVGNVPAGTFLADANEIVGAERIFPEKSGGSLGAFSDLFRFELLGHKGGVWVDMDLVCLRPLDFSYEYLFGWEDSDRINTAILGAPGNSELVTTLRQVCTSPFIDQP
ncbi:MAG: glycosyltransferase [Burkholderiales bacterium]